MELRRGYKLTEVGVIPEGWKVNALPEISWFQEGPGLRNWQFTSAGMKVINVTNLEHGVLNLERTDRHISIAEFNRMYRHFAIDAADIVMASSGNSYCKTAAVREQDLPLVMNTSVIRFKPSQSCDYGFLWVILTSPLFKGQIDLMITGGAQPNFGPYHLKRVLVPVPPLAEQRAIAAALNDVDALLGGLERLIAKKRDLKQASMQQLLTGQTRLPGFSGEWEDVEFGHIACIRNTKVIASSRPAGTQCVELDAISQETGRLLTSTEATGDSSKYSFKSGDVLFGRLRAYLRKYWLATFDGICSTEIWPLISRDERLCSGFLHLLVQTNEFVNAAGVSYGTHMPRSDWSVLKKSAVRLPSPAEQTAIATVLSDMDTELAALEARRDKTRAVKQAMMQELLTGRVRLISGELKVESG